MTSETSSLTKSQDSSGATSSPASEAGTLRLREQLGPLIARYGLAQLLANLSARQVAEAGLLTSGTFGPASTTSSRSANLNSCLESRLRALLTGSDLCEVNIAGNDLARGRFYVYGSFGKPLLDQFAVVGVEFDQDAVAVQGFRYEAGGAGAAEDVHADSRLH